MKIGEFGPILRATHLPLKFFGPCHFLIAPPFSFSLLIFRPEQRRPMEEWEGKFQGRVLRPPLCGRSTEVIFTYVGTLPFTIFLPPPRSFCPPLPWFHGKSLKDWGTRLMTRPIELLSLIRFFRFFFFF